MAGGEADGVPRHPHGHHAHGHGARQNLKMYVSRLKMGHRKHEEAKKHELHTQPVSTRLQALFYSSPSGTPLVQDPSAPLSPPAPPMITFGTPDLPHAPTPLFLKVRIVSWNMNDSVPKGDLSELLGHVPLYHHHGHDASRLRLPDLTLEPGHPYHILVVAGQECPTLSGMPRGIGAFKLQDKEREIKEREKEKEREAKREAKRRRKLFKHEEESDDDSDADRDGAKHHHPHPAGGWTSILEDWLSVGVGAVPGARPLVDDSEVIPFSSPMGPLPSPSPLFQPDTSGRTKEQNPWDIPPNKEKQVQKERGPYELILKERLMGLYLAIYVHRDVRPLVKGLSKSTVTAGLIGGRLGNKGGIGVSMNINGIRILFVNAHLAAHGDKTHLRAANLQKIKSELTVETFLKPDDPRNMAEDISDRFDYTFLFGDLNYRLDISRLHADWLVARKDYATALKFDQLLKEMQTGNAFTGFSEAPIDFPPTFKYDVLKTLKGKPRRKSTKSRHSAEPIAEEQDTDGHSFREDGARTSREGARWDDHSPAPSDAETDVSSAWTSRTALDDESENFLSPTSAVGEQSPAVLHLQMLAQKTAFHAKRNLVNIIAPVGSPMRARMSMREKAERRRGEMYALGGAPAKSDPALARSKSLQVPSNTELYSGSEQDLTNMRPQPERMGSGSSGDQPGEDASRAVYDTSSKRRVPSWCDRVLWKSTVLPEPDPLVDTGRGKPGFGGMFSRLRKRRESDSSTVSGSTLATSSSSGHTTTRAPESRGTTDSTQTQKDSPTVPKSFPVGPGSPPESADAPHRPRWYFQRHAGKRSLSSSASLENANAVATDHAQVDRPRTASGSNMKRMVSLPLPPPPPLSIQTSLTRTASGAGAARTSPPSRGETYPPAGALPSPPPFDGSRPMPPPQQRWTERLFSWAMPGPDSPSPVAEPASSPGLPPPPPVHRKGDVVCINYTSLDDRSMRRLEGRSDHRPVIAEYALFL